MDAPVIPNAVARRLFLHRHALAEAPTGPASGAALAGLIDRIGFVQVDSILTVERAHHMILWSRRRSYRPAALKSLLERDRLMFEHWTHDASILPVALFPHWKHRFARDADRLQASWQRWFRPGYESLLDGIVDRIRDTGPVTSAEVGEGEARGKGGWWDWHPSKTALEWLWRTGRLSVTRRDAFRKVYDLTDRVIPAEWRLADMPLRDSDDALNAMALARLGFADAAEIARYWNAVPADAVRDWATRGLRDGSLQAVRVEGADGSLRPALVTTGTLVEPLPEPPAGPRILSPFDPALRDRNRAERLFGFRYRIEVFVPEARREYGYYVLPVLEGARLIGRIDARADRAQRRLAVRAFWPEAGVRMTAGRQARLVSELERLARFAGCDGITLAPDWQR
jgi:uncharacterized protein YcaQ